MADQENKDIKEAVEEPTKEQEELIALPAVESPMYNFNGDTGAFWIGLPLLKMDLTSIMLMLDSYKLEAAKVLGALKLEQKRKENAIVRPDGSAFQKTKAFVNSLRK